jgi:hypothetical protein
VRIVLNSDVLYHHERAVENRLSARITRLLEACKTQGHEIVIPHTTRLEFDRHQFEEVRKERQGLKAAYALLQRHGVRHSGDAPETVIGQAELIPLIEQFGVPVSELSPSLEDFQDAHRRAALREPPHPPDTKSDEMRDLVIWAQALRVAREANGALLVSADVVHVHPRGDAEAHGVGLVRVKSVEEAMEYLEVLTPTGELLDRLLRPTWTELVAAEPQLPENLVLLGVHGASFVQGAAGLATAAGQIRARGADGKVLEAEVKMVLESGVAAEVTIDNAKLGDKTLPAVSISRQVEIGEPEGGTDVNRRLQRLRRVLGQ